MAGLINSQMAPAVEQEPAQGPGPAASVGMTEGQAPEADDANAEAEDDPNYAAALKFAMEAMYKGEGAQGIAKSLQTSNDPVEGLANTAYEITSIVDERTQGAVPDEFFALLATRILGEVIDIGEAAGVKFKPSDSALALKQMILRYLGEQGVDTTQLQQAMDQVDPEEFNRMAEEGDSEEMMA